MVVEKGQDTNLEKAEQELLVKHLGGDLVNLLTAPTPKAYIESRPIRGGGTARYVAGWRFTQRLNQVFGFLWSTHIKEAHRDGDHVVVQGELTFKIPGRTIIREFPDGTKETTIFEGLEVTKSQFGGSEIKRYAKPTGKYKAGDVMDIGNDFKAAATDAKKRCAVETGMFLDVYSSRSTEEEGPGEAQLDVLYMRGGRAGMDKAQTDTWVEEELGKKTLDCEDAELMGVIPRLIRMAQEKK